MSYQVRFCSNCLTDRRFYSDRPLVYCGVCGHCAKLGRAADEEIRQTIQRRFGRIMEERSTT